MSKETLSENGQGPPSRGKMIALAVIVVVVGLVIFLGVFWAMSRGLTSVAERAAQGLQPATPGASVDGGAARVDGATHAGSADRPSAGESLQTPSAPGL